MRKSFLTLFLLIIFMLIPVAVYSQIGVGVGTGKIVVDEELKPGTIYKFPPLIVLNTGKVPANYSLTITYHQDQEEREPPVEWFIFDPDRFYLEPGETQTVQVRANIPVNARPGDYFGYLEAYPDVETDSGVTAISIAAAAKMYFTIAPANIFEGIYYRLLSLWETYQPWTTRGAIGVGALIIIMIFRKYFNIDINLRSKKGDSNGQKISSIADE